MGCFSCGSASGKTVNQILLIYFNIYKTTGKEYYFYKTSSNGDVFIIEKEQFNEVYNKQIQPNLVNGAEFAHISEFRAT